MNKNEIKSYFKNIYELNASIENEFLKIKENLRCLDRMGLNIDEFLEKRDILSKDFNKFKIDFNEKIKKFLRGL